MNTNDQPRQRVNVRVHVSADYGRVAPLVMPADAEQPIASVDLIEGIALQTDDPAIFRTFADAFTRAAASIDSALAQRADAVAKADTEAVPA